MTARWVTSDRKVVDVIYVKYPGSGAVAGPQYRVRDIHGHPIGSGTVKTVAELSALGIDLADLEEIS